MADILSTIFNNKKVIFSKLVPFGFREDSTGFVYEKILSESGFQLIVTITAQGEITTEVIDPAFHEPYVLHLVDGAVGSFVGSVKAQYEETLTEIAANCCENEFFKSAQAKALIQHVRNVHADELEYLWKKFPNNAVWRRKDTGKWYAALLTVSKRKLGIDSDEIVEIIDLRIPPEQLKALIDNRAYFPGYHMNKNHWYTIILDGSVSIEEICERIEQSYLLAVK